MRHYSALLCLLLLVQGCKQVEQKEESSNIAQEEPSQNFLNSEITVVTGLYQRDARGNGSMVQPEVFEVDMNQAGQSLTLKYKAQIKNRAYISLQYAIDGQHFRNAPEGSVTGDLQIESSGEYGLKWNFGDLALADQSILRIVLQDDEQIEVEKLVASVDKNTIINDLNEVVGSRNYFDEESIKKIKQVAGYIEQRAGESGFMVRRQEFENNRIQQAGIPKPANIIATLPGIKHPEKSIVIMFHIDTVERSPGADDNGTGISSALSLMKILGHYSFDYTLRFAAVDLEEVGVLGSFVFASEDAIAEDEEIIAGFNIDMIGYTSEEPYSQLIPDGFDQVFPEIFKAIEADSRRGNFGIAVGNEIARPINLAFEVSRARYAPDLKMHYLNLAGRGEDFIELRRGDHMHFWDKDIPMVYLGDGADSRNRNYHGVTDLAATLNFDHVTGLTKTVLATLADLAKIRNAQEVSFSTQLPLASN